MCIWLLTGKYFMPFLSKLTFVYKVNKTKWLQCCYNFVSHDNIFRLSSTWCCWLWGENFRLILSKQQKPHHWWMLRMCRMTMHDDEDVPEDGWSQDVIGRCGKVWRLSISDQGWQALRTFFRYHPMWQSHGGQILYKQISHSLCCR